MNLQRNKTLSTIALILILTFAALTTYVPSAKAAEVSTYAYLAVSPNPVGVNQQLTVIIWVLPLPPTITDVMHDFQVTITKPDGTTETKGPLVSTPGGMQFLVYTPTAVGTYTFQLKYPGETFTSTGDVYSASTSPTTTVVVQSQPITPLPEVPLPTDYWTRPINTQNKNWYSVSGNWLMRNYNNMHTPWDTAAGFNPYSQAARSSHVVWTKEIALGGLVGGQSGSAAYYAGLSYEWKFAPPVVMNGRVYYNNYWGVNMGPPPLLPGFTCLDLRTGQELWQNKNGTIDCGQLYDFTSGNQGGVLPYLWSTSTDTWNVYDAFSGDLLLSFNNALSSGGYLAIARLVYGPNGELLYYFFDGADRWFAMWNSTKAFEANGMIPSSGPAGLLLWRPTPGTYDWTTGIQWNVTTPDVGGVLSLPNGNIVDNDVLIATTASYGGTGSSSIEAGYSLQTGQQLWVKNRPFYMIYQTFGAGIYADWNSKTRTWLGFDAETGNQLWESDPTQYPWGAFISDMGGTMAYGIMYCGALDGYVRAFSITTGKQVWQFFCGNSGTETPYGVYPVYSGCVIADGVVYASTCEHGNGLGPTFRGEKLFAIDAYSGKELWSMNGLFSPQAIADGYFLAFNAYDNRVYCFGKGPSATTVQAPLSGVDKGTQITITGTVTDQSAGQPNTPAVSDQSMSVWMANMKEQQTINGTIIGVPVKLTAQAPDGSTINIADVTSDAYGNFFYSWTPPSTGLYRIAATMSGTDSYGSSSAETGLTVSGTTSGGPTATDSLGMYIIVATVLIIIAITVVGILVLRKRPKP